MLFRIEDTENIDGCHRQYTIPFDELPRMRMSELEKYLASENEWEIRVALVIMLDYYLDDEYIDRVLERCDSVKNDAYYVSMAKAWLVATAVAKCKDKAMAYLLDNSLDNDTFNKAIQKCIESRRIDNETKDYLRTLKK